MSDRHMHIIMSRSYNALLRRVAQPLCDNVTSVSSPTKVMTPDPDLTQIMQRSPL